MRDEYDVRLDMCEIGRRLYDRKYIVGTDGNLSVRLPGNVVLCTPSGVCKGELEPEALLKVRLDGQKICGPGSPSSELQLHLAIYRKRTDVRAAVHAHPLAAVALTVGGECGLETPLIAEVPIHLGRIAVAPYATPGTQDLAESTARFLEASDAVVLARHGALTVGRTLLEAYHRMEWLEYAAQVTQQARQSGSPIPLDPAEVKRLTRGR
jgi:L-fuculose-phosphate aldolase